jgi:hypothetical protein
VAVYCNIVLICALCGGRQPDCAGNHIRGGVTTAFNRCQGCGHVFGTRIVSRVSDVHFVEADNLKVPAITYEVGLDKILIGC